MSFLASLFCHVAGVFNCDVLFLGLLRSVILLVLPAPSLTKVWAPGPNLPTFYVLFSSPSSLGKNSITECSGFYIFICIKFLKATWFSSPKTLIYIKFFSGTVLSVSTENAGLNSDRWVLPKSVDTCDVVNDNTETRFHFYGCPME